MLGAIIGDTVGSRFGFANTHRTGFELFARGCDYTDDTICIVAIVDTLLRGADFVDALQTWCRRYPHPRGVYGGHSHQWTYTTPPVPYHSFGNDSAMRISLCGWLPARDAVLSQVKTSAKCTYSHPGRIRGAVVIVETIYLLRGGASKTDLKKHLGGTYHYDLTRGVDYVREHSSFDETCQVAVLQTIVCFLAGYTFEEVICPTISIGGGNGTIGAVSGSLAEAHLGIPPKIQQCAFAYLPEDMRQIVGSFHRTIR